MADTLIDTRDADSVGDPPEGTEEVEPFGWITVPHPTDPSDVARLYHKDGSIRNKDGSGQMVERHPDIGADKPEVQEKIQATRKSRKDAVKEKMREGWLNGVLNSTQFKMQKAFQLLEEGDDTAFIISKIVEQMLDPKTPLRDRVMAFEKIGELADIHSGKRARDGKIADTIVLNISREVLLESFDDDEQFDVIDVTPADVPF